MANVFDQFDAPAAGQGQASPAAAAPPPANVFDQFDAPPQAAPGIGEAALRSAAQGLSYGFGDEAYALGAGVKSWQQGKGFQTGYDEALSRYRGEDKAAEAAHPYVSLGAKLAGGAAAAVPAMIAAPAAFGLTAPTLAGRIGLGAGSGFGLGAVSGFGEGEGDGRDQLISAGTGAIGGAAFGAAAPVVGSAAGKVLTPLLQGAAERAAPVPGMSNAAARMVAEDLERSGGRTAIDARMAQLGPEARLVDASPSFTGSGQGLAARPEAAQIIADPIRARNAGTDARLAADLTANLGPAPVPSQVEAGFARQRAAAGPMYERSLAEAGPVDTSGALAEIGQRLNTASGAERAGLTRARDLLLEQGERGAVPRSDPRYLHNAKQSLDDLIHYGDDTIGVPRGALSREDNAVSAVRRRLNQALEEQTPGYAEANLRARTAYGASEALESGKRVLDMGQNAINPADFAPAFAARPIEQQAAARLGVRGDLDRIVGTSSNDLVALRRQFGNEWNQAKLGEVFGPQEAQRIVGSVDREAAFRDAYTKLVEGSQTAQRSAAAGRFDVKPAGSSDMTMPIASIGGPKAMAIAGALKGLKGANAEATEAANVLRNQQVARFLIQQAGPELDATLGALSSRAARVQAAQATALRSRAIAEALLRSSGPETAQRARRYVLPGR